MSFRFNSYGMFSRFNSYQMSSGFHFILNVSLQGSIHTKCPRGLKSDKMSFGFQFILNVPRFNSHEVSSGF